MNATKSSHVRGDISPPLLEDTIGEILTRAVERWPHADALVSVHQGVRWSFAELNERVDALAAGLLALGLAPGDRVGIWAPNCAEWALTQFATARVGLIQVNINPAYRLAELEYTLAKVGVKALLSADAFKSSDYLGMVEALVARDRVEPAGRAAIPRDSPSCKVVAKIGGPPRAGWLEFADLTSADRERVRSAAAQTRNTQPINIQFTSGTTGFAEGRHALAPEHRQQRVLRRPEHGAARRRPAVRARAAVSLLRNGDGEPRLHRARRHHGVSRPPVSNRWPC